MKKLLAMVLVLGLASVASAALDVVSGGASILGGQVAMDTPVSLVSPDGVTSYETTFSGVAVDTSGIAFPATFDFAGKIADSGANYVLVTAAQFFGGPQSGDLVTGIEFTETGIVTVLEGGSVLGSFEVIPEPITMSLLGLGGLVAIRRRR